MGTGKEGEKTISHITEFSDLKLIPMNGTTIWKTELVLSCYPNVMRYTAVGGYYLLHGLQVHTETPERQSSPLLCSIYLAKEGTKTSPLYKRVYIDMSAFPSPPPPPHETQEGPFPFAI